MHVAASVLSTRCRYSYQSSIAPSTLDAPVRRSWVRVSCVTILWNRARCSAVACLCLRRPLRLRLLPPGVARLVVARRAHVLPLLARRPALGVDVGLGQSSHVVPSAAAGTAPLHACSADAIERVFYASPAAGPHSGPAGRVHRLPRPPPPRQG